MTSSQAKIYSREYLEAMTPACCKDIARQLGIKPRFHKRKVIAQIRLHQTLKQVEQETRQFLQAHDLIISIENRWIIVQTKDGTTIATSPYWGNIHRAVRNWLEDRQFMQSYQNRLVNSFSSEPTSAYVASQGSLELIKNSSAGLIKLGSIAWFVPNVTGLLESLQLEEEWDLVDIKVSTGTKTIRHRGYKILSEPNYRAFAIYQSKHLKRKDGQPCRWAKRISMKSWQQYEICFLEAKLTAISEKLLEKNIEYTTIFALNLQPVVYVRTQEINAEFENKVPVASSPKLLDDWPLDF